MISYRREKANVKLYFSKPFFYVGEFIIGNIEIYLQSSAIITGILIKITINEMWKINDLDTNSNNYDKTIINYNLDLRKFKNLNFINGNDILLAPGSTKIPFNFRFSEEHCPCFEYPLPNKRASIRYNFSVTIISQYITAFATYYLCLIARPIIDTEKLLTKSDSQSIKKWKMFDKGETSLKITLPENNFRYDSECMVTIDIDNTNGKVPTKEYKIMLIRKVVFKNDKSEVKCTDEANIVSKRIKAVVEPGKKDTFTFKMTFMEDDASKKYNYDSKINPYHPEMRQINYYMPTVHGNTITCDYTIKVSLYFDCFVAYDNRPRIIIPVYLVHQSPLDYQLEIQEQIDLENALTNSKNSHANDKNKKYINDYNYNNNNNTIKINDNNNNKNNNNYILANNNIENDEDEALPSLEDIENSKKNNNIINENDIIINKIDTKNEEFGLESAPAPFLINNEHIENKNNNNIINNNIYTDNNNNNNFNNFKINKNISENNININNNNIYNDDKNINTNTNINNSKKKDSEDFSLFDGENVTAGNYIENNPEPEKAPKIIYQNINEE